VAVAFAPMEIFTVTHKALVLVGVCCATVLVIVKTGPMKVFKPVVRQPVRYNKHNEHYYDYSSNISINFVLALV